VSAAEEAFLIAWRLDPLPGAELVREYRFHDVRRWRLDFAIPAVRVGVEIDGRGRHQSVVGERKDMEKLNTALLLGWRVLRFSASEKKKAAEWVETVKELVCSIPR
jgi:very-short-patch-repair endonuclease